MIALTEKLLSGAGGWAAMKAARELVKAGRVSSATYEAPLLVGQVREGTKNYRAGLRIRSTTDVENICTCRESREWGKVCPHSLAVGLAVLAPAPALSLPPPLAPNEERDGSSLRRFCALGEEGALAVTLHFILPPHFCSAWEKDRIMVGIEAETAGRRVLLDALPTGKSFACDDHDRSAMDSLGVEALGINTLSAAEFLQWLSALRGHPRVTFGKSKPAEISAEIARPRLTMRQIGDDWEVAADLGAGDLALVAGDVVWLLSADRFVAVGSSLPPRLTKALQEPLRLRRERVDEFLGFELSLWREVADIDRPPDLMLPKVVEAQPFFHLKIEGSLQHLRAILRCRYGDRPLFPPGANPADRFVLRDLSHAGQLLVRNLVAEQTALERLQAIGFTPNDDACEMRDARSIVRFFAFDFPALPRTWDISISPCLTRITEDLEPVAPVIEIVRSGEDWFELKYSVATDAGEGIPLAEVQRLLRTGQTQTRMKNGKIAVLNADALADFEELLRETDPRQSQPGVYRLKKIQATYLTNTAEEIGAKLVGAAETLRSHDEPGVIDRLGSLGGQLRDYQLTGVSWIAALAAQGLGGILADEMGLGKTVQTLAFLHLDRGHGTTLIVCPTSLLTNWQREAERFTPQLTVLLIDGPNRGEKISRLAEYDLALTSYGLLRRDIELYADCALRSVVLDEAQHIKNPDTQNAQAAFGLRARTRFVLTGTPMENSVRDLWSMMNFVAPGYLGSRADFRERYEKPLTEGRASARPPLALQRRLARRLRPFLLRRRKVEVARELPEKIEQVVPCELGPVQRATYDALLREIQHGLGASGESNGATRMKMLTGLLRLRQTCCDLRLLGLESAGDSHDAPDVFGETPKTAGEGARAPQARESYSAKLDLLDELLEEIIDGGHRVLIFSQFVQMLNLIRERLEASKTAHCFLAGLTRQRQAEVDRFQNDALIPVFLISLKAGGVGLNLSAADTVIHFDPWWNAAVEAQATDRAHRIGQTRVVTSYKLIARDTVEEKILNLQKRKRAMASALLESEEPLMSGLTTKELTELLT